MWSIDPVGGRRHDPEGLLGTLPAIATTLLGLHAGCWLRGARRGARLGGGLLALASGLLWSMWLLFNKNLWTPSFVSWTAGWAMLARLACHWLVNRCGWPAWGRRFGVHAIAAYACSQCMQIALPTLGQASWYRASLADWMTPRLGPWMPSLAFAVLYVGFWWVVVRGMDRRGLHLKL